MRSARRRGSCGRTSNGGARDCVAARARLMGSTPAVRTVRGERSFAMPRYLISFDDGSMDHISADDMPAVGEAAHAVVREAKAAGVWIFGAGLQRQQSTVVATDGTNARGPFP